MDDVSLHTDSHAFFTLGQILPWRAGIVNKKIRFFLFFQFCMNRQSSSSGNASNDPRSEESSERNGQRLPNTYLPVVLRVIWPDVSRS
jgi:hypothetical protein